MYGLHLPMEWNSHISYFKTEAEARSWIGDNSASVAHGVQSAYIRARSLMVRQRSSMLIE